MRRKTVFLAVALLGLMVTRAEAFFLFPEITNFSQASEDHPDLGRFPLRTYQEPFKGFQDFDDGFGFDALGTAFEFSLEKDLVVKSISSPIDVFRGLDCSGSGCDPVPGKIDMHFVLYRGSTDQYGSDNTLPDGWRIPKPGSEVYREKFTATGNSLVPYGRPGPGRIFTYQGADDLNLVLPADRYWASYWTVSGAVYVQPKVRLEAHAVPEPATLALFGSGILGLAFRKKRG